MFRLIVFLFILIPAVEIWGLITVGKWIGALPTFGLVLLTGFVGAFMAKKEALRVWQYARFQMASGQIPTRSILDGICIFAGGLMLLTPGFVTDFLGFLLIFPLSRGWFAARILAFIQKRIQSGGFHIFFRKN